MQDGSKRVIKFQSSYTLENFIFTQISRTPLNWNYNINYFGAFNISIS
jgi:hypothetical protein